LMLTPLFHWRKFRNRSAKRSREGIGKNHPEVSERTGGQNISRVPNLGK
jgi:hypothetical protein